MEPKMRCKHCHQLLPPNPHVKNHQYCSRKACQRARKTRWQRKKMATDPDYRKNQVESLENWRKHNSDYWRQYRESHEDYRDRNRQLQKVRDARRRAKRLAKMDASMLKIFIIPDTCWETTRSCKKGLDGHGLGNGVSCGIKEGAGHDVHPALPGSGP